MGEDQLQFDEVKDGGAAPEAAPCGACKAPLRDRYFEVNGKRICEACRAKLASWPPGTPGHRFMRALGRGAGWAVLGAIAYYLMLSVAHIELGIVSIFIGFYVGRAVKNGSYGVGGEAYQALAMALTYLSIAAAYYALLIEVARSQGAVIAPLGYLKAVWIAIEAPFLPGAENILGILIIFFGIYQAWRLNKRHVIAISGPFEIKPAPSPEHAG